MAWVVTATAILSVSSGVAFGQRLSAQDSGDRIYDFTALDTAGQKHDRAAYRGKIVLLDFWATWCPPCRGEVPYVVKAYKEFHSKGFEVLGVSLDRSEAAIKPFTSKAGMAWPEVFDPSQKSSLAQKFQVKGIPTNYLIDGTTGKIIAKDLRGDALRAKVRAAIVAAPKRK